MANKFHKNLMKSEKGRIISKDILNARINRLIK